jgi:hypothetical protein
MRAKQVIMVVCILVVLHTMTGTAFCRGARAVGMGQIEGQPSSLMTPAEYQRFLGRLKIDLARWQVQLAKIDVDAVVREHIMGMIVEKDVRSAHSAVEECQTWEGRLEKRQTFGDEVRLYSSFETLNQSIDQLYESLNWIVGDSAELRKWERELTVPQKQIHEDTIRLRGHVVSLADIADDACPQLRRYLQ